MKIFVRRKELKALVGLSYQHIHRLELEGKFPARVRLTDHPNGAVGWSYEEIQQWANARMNKRLSQ